MKKLLFMLLASASLIACETGEETQKPIELTGGTTPSQTVYADETQKTEGIKFKATADWEATVNQLTSRATDNDGWLRLSANNGGAGDVTLTIFLDQNGTGKDRKAEIRITCGGTTIIIIVEQKATNKPVDPDIQQPLPMRRYVKKITSESSSSGGSFNKNEMVFEYDKEKRITKIAVKNADTFNGVTENLDRNLYFTYKPNTISIDVQDVGDVEQTQDLVFEVTLNPDGTAKQCFEFIEYPNGELSGSDNVKSAMFSSIKARAKSKEGAVSKMKNTRDFTYVQGYVDKIAHYTELNGTLIQSLDFSVLWSHSNLTKIQTTLPSGLVGSDEFKYSDIPSMPCNWDLLSVGSGEWTSSAFNVVGTLGLMGKQSKMLPSSLVSRDGEYTYRRLFTYTLDKMGYIVSIKNVNGDSSIGDAITPDAPMYNEITNIEYVK